MRFRFLALLMAVVVASGCASRQTATTNSAGDNSSNLDNGSMNTTNRVDGKLIVTPENLLVGIVTTYNTAGRFVVVDFPVGRMPAPDQVMFIYRQGLKVGEARIAGPERDHMTVADLIAGEARKGDEVRDK